MQKYNFEQITVRQQITSRGGGIEITLDTLGFLGGKMAAYQNYVGGGLLGKVIVNDNIQSTDKPISKSKLAKLEAIGDQLKRYFHDLTNPVGEENEWETRSYEQNQNMPVSGY